ncbi:MULTISPECIES: hypothetical protein [unclassified Ensifer]|uniref:hypothetical protein n=1 Tax=unclassified Ensifer TaxID=2633371 RepID=UPI00070ADBBE|nr:MULTISPECIES: hypothetical protein [unclassified Ensifer]KQW62863.1 hypothetical protein ASD02_01705 [Ensifer sp. Root1252]KRC83684.1 hypothetical protein ASE32_01695 [Ensifer sp. Root231]KRD04037.1 hypothetical protein ASE47_00355 [Ensifer sp. Root258]
MAHIRTQLRSQVVEILKGSALVGNRVHASRARPLGRNEQTSAFVYTSTEQSSDIDTDGNQLRQIRVKIDVVTKGDEAGRQDDLDGFAIHVEQAFANDPTLGGIASASEYRSTDFGANVEGEKVLQVMSILYEVAAITLNSNPETIR